MGRKRIQKEREHKPWTKEEEDYLTDSWGDVSIDTIAGRLKRTKDAVINRAIKLNLGAYLDSGEYVTWNQFLNILIGNNSNSYKYESWIKKRDFPVRYKKCRHMCFKVIYLDEFWEWAEKNQSFLDFSKFEPHALGREPEWAKKKRRRDIERARKYITTPWTEADDSRLKRMLAKKMYTCTELSKVLRRTEGAVVRRINDLNLTDKPLKADNHIKWTEEEFKKLAQMISENLSYEEMSDVIGKSSKAIRGRVYTMYLTENLDAVRKIMNGGAWGDNRPERKIRHRNVMNPEEKMEAKDLLERLAAVLQKEFTRQANATGWAEFFQKDMCQNFDGDCLKTKGCDECSHFKRMDPQVCKICGRTFFEQKNNNYCISCRKMRKIQYLRKEKTLTK